MDRILARLKEIERRLARESDQRARLKEWLTNVEQRIRELPTGNSSANGSTDPAEIADGVHATGVVSTAITKATSATVPGQGEFQRYTTFDPTAPLLDDITGVDEPIFSIDRQFKVTAGAVVHAIKWRGVWWVIMVDDCTNLDPT